MNKQLDIRIFNLASGRQIIGELITVEDGCAYVAYPMAMNTKWKKDGSYKLKLTPLVPEADNETPLSLYLEHIESECFATEKLEEQYVYHLVCCHIKDQQQVYEPNLALSSTDEHWKQFKDRLN